MAFIIFVVLLLPAGIVFLCVASHELDLVADRYSGLGIEIYFQLADFFTYLLT